MMVKICGITNREDALAAAEAGASALGFNFYPKSSRFITPERASRIVRELPPSVVKAGVFVNEPPESVIAAVEEAGLDVAQLHGDESPDTLPGGLRIWKAFRVGENFEPGSLEKFDVEAFLLDAPSPDLFGGTGRAFDWSRATGIGRKIILAGGLDEHNVRMAIQTVRPWGVDACSRLETSPGRKDHGKMTRFLRAALSEDAG